MKKALIASVLGIVASVATTQGQGFIQFNNYASTTYQEVAYNNGITTANANNPAFTVQLFWGLGVITDPNALTAGVTASINPVDLNAAGTYGSGGPGGYFAGSQNQTIVGYTSGSVTFMVRAWDSTGGATFLTSGSKGQSLLWQEGRSDGIGGSGVALGVEPVGYFGSGPSPTSGPLLVIAVPEPSTFALIGLGTGALLFFRRRK